MDAKSETRRDASETPRRGSLFDNTVIDRRSFVKGMAAVSVLPFLATGCRRFGLTREAQLAGGAPVRIAIIGCGDWGRTLLNRAGASDRCALVALSDPDPKAIADLQAKCAPVWGRAALEGAKVFPDYRELFEQVGDELDAVFVATPNHHHALPSILAANRGIHVFVEKPMVHTYEEALALEKAVRRTGVVLRVGNKGHNMTHRPYLAKGLIYEEFHRTLRFFPEGGKIADLPVPDKKTLESEECRIVAEFLSAVRGRPGEDNTGLDFSLPLVKTLMLSNMLVFAGKGTYGIEGDRTTSAVANAHAKMTYRTGWNPLA